MQLYSDIFIVQSLYAMNNHNVFPRSREKKEGKMRIHTVGIVSLSSGILGEDFVQHEREIGEERLRAMGLTVRYMPHAKSGVEYIKTHPDKRAQDLLTALRDPEIDMILCAIGGDDTYRLAPYLFEDNALQRAFREIKTEKIFLGFSDTTLNHLMFHKIGMPTFYGQAFVPDICELSHKMLPYTERYFRELVETGTIRRVQPSEIWYECRSDFTPAQIGMEQKTHPHEGFTLLQGSPYFHGRILGGCIDSLYDMFSPARYPDMPEICMRYGLFPTAEDWHNRILLLETSEEKMSPEKYREALYCLRDAGVFGAVSGILVGKPMDGMYEAAYKEVLCEVIDNPALSVVWGVNIGHALPRCILPFGVEAEVDAEAQVIRFL